MYTMSLLRQRKDENLKQKSREERWVDMKFTIYSSASGRHPSSVDYVRKEETKICSQTLCYDEEKMRI